jgi:hypothetical protein
VLPDKLLTPTVENNSDDEMIDHIRLLLCQGRSDRHIRLLLRLSPERYQQLRAQMRVCTVAPEKAESAFAEFADEFAKFQMRCEAQLELLTQVEKQCHHPFGIDTGVFKVLRSKSRLETQLLKARANLLGIKISLGLVTIPAQAPALLGGDDTPFKSTTIKAAWEQRMLANGSTKH